MSQIETTQSKCNVLTFSWPKTVIDIWTSSLFDFRKNSIFQRKTCWSKLFWLALLGMETEGNCRRNKCYGFSARVILLSLTLSVWGSMGQKWSWYWDTYSHPQPGTSFLALDSSYGVPVTCPALYSAERLTLMITQRSSDIIPPIGTAMEKEVLVVSCSAWLRGSWSCMLACTCPFQALYRRDI